MQELALLTIATVPYTQGVPRRAALALQHLPASPTTHPVAAAVARMAPTTRRTFLGSVQRAAQLLTGGRGDAWSCPWAALRYENMLALRQALVDLHLAPATVNGIRAAVRAVCMEAWRLGQMDGGVLLRIKDVPLVRGRRDPTIGRMLDRSELGQLVASCRRGGLLGARDGALLALLYGAGLRRSEAVYLQVSDLRPDGVRVRGKGNVEVIQPVPPAVRPLLLAWIRHRGRLPGPLLMPVDRFGRIQRRRLHPDAVYTALVRRARLIGLRHFSPHDLRRSYGSHLLDRGVELRVVQQLMRHAQVTTTQRYDRRPHRQLGAAAARVPL